MTPSPLKFARSFERLKSRLQNQPAGDLRLLMLVEYWPSLSQHLSEPGYRSFFEEYVPLLLEQISGRNLEDLLPHELKRLLEIALSLRQTEFIQVSAEEFERKVELVATETARKFFYVGAVEEGLKCLACLTRAYPQVSLSLSKAPRRTEPLGGSVAEVTLSLRRPEPVEGSKGDSWSEIEILRHAREQLADADSPLKAVVDRILREWEIECEALSFEEARCLFVEKNDHGDNGRGRLRTLWGSVEYRSKGARSDEVTFENQLKAPDDPFVGVVYDSVKAVALLMRRTRSGKGNRHHIRARYRIAASDHTFTGDSIGLAAGLVAYTQLLKPEVLKHERFVACEAAFTGGVDETGRLTPVGEDSLRLKIERVFFSPLKFLVLPQANLDAARMCVGQLQREFPRRQLRLVGANTLAEVIDDRNIVRAEKVCMGPYVARKTLKYSRATKVQVPLLVVLAYLLICLIYPKAWIGFDRSPEYVRLTERGFQALNQDSIPLWEVEYECDSLEPASAYKIADLNDNGRNEVLFLPRATENAPCEADVQLYVYSQAGDFMFRRQCVIPGQYPGDTTIHQAYNVSSIEIADVADEKIIITQAYRSYPARTHFKFWNAKGDSLGWYVNAGHGGAFGKNLAVDSESRLIFLSYNSPTGCASMFALVPDSSYGVSPPYEIPFHRATELKRGTQMCYMIFPRSEINRQLHSLYNHPAGLVIESGGVLRADVNELGGSAVLSYYFDENLRVIDVKADDRFKAVRDSLVLQGMHEPMTYSAYVIALQDAVTYWTDSGWVTEGQLRAAGK